MDERDCFFFREAPEERRPAAFLAYTFCRTLLDIATFRFVTIGLFNFYSNEVATYAADKVGKPGGRERPPVLLPPVAPDLLLEGCPDAALSS